MRKSISLLLILFIFIQFCDAKPSAYTLLSPDKAIKCVFKYDSSTGTLSYRLFYNEKEIISPSDLGYQLDEMGKIPDKNWKVANVEKKKENKVWYPIWGKRKVVYDKYNQVTLTLRVGKNCNNSPISRISVQARMYDDGCAFRYIIPEGDNTPAKKERTNFAFSDNYTAWFTNGEHPNIGPVKLQEDSGVRSPVATLKANDSLYIAIHEAFLQEGDPLRLCSETGSLRYSIASSPGILGQLRKGYESAWRVIMVGRSPGSLVDSHMIELLNPAPNDSIDFSWVKPGLAVWDWRINGAIWDDFTYGMNYTSWTRMIDFAQKQNMTALVLDANWYGPEHEAESDPVKGEKATDVQKIIQYGNERGVDVWLYLNDVGGKKYPIEQTLKQYKDWGAAGIKYGFMRGTPEEKNSWTQKITRLCAENKLHVDFHDYPIHPYGQMRTWPNALTREFCHAQLDAHRVFTPTTFVTSVFVNMVAGPIDMNNGFFDLRTQPTTRVDESRPIPTTIVSEAARTLVVFSGITILPDIPEYYQKYPFLLRFISGQKMPWIESKTLQGEIGEYIVMMRRNENGYYIAAVNNEESRTIEIPLSFLSGDSYVAQITADGDDAHYLTNKLSWKSWKQSVDNSDVLKIKLAPGGGCCILIN